MTSPDLPGIQILMVCMGNICRSPTAEGVLRAKLAQAGLSAQVLVESAGTHNYHPGSPPDARSQAHALRRGIDLSGLKARQVQQDDYADFDLILAMDWDNLALLQVDCPPQYAAKLKLLMEFAVGVREPESAASAASAVSVDSPGTAPSGQGGTGISAVVPDPYHGGEAGFEQVLDLVELACGGLVAHLRSALVAHRP